MDPDNLVERQDSTDEGITYDSQGRMQYHPDFHFSHRAAFTQEDLEYLCKFYEVDDTRTIAFALGKTESTQRGAPA